MSPNDDQSRPQQSSAADSNPFIAFRRYADEQISSFAQSFVGQPVAHARWLDDGRDTQRRTAIKVTDENSPRAQPYRSSFGKDDDDDDDNRQRDNKNKRRTREPDDDEAKSKGSDEADPSSWLWDLWNRGRYGSTPWEEQEGLEQRAERMMVGAIRGMRGLFRDREEPWDRPNPVPPFPTLQEFLRDGLDGRHVGMDDFLGPRLSNNHVFRWTAYDAFCDNLQGWPGWHGYLIFSPYSPIALEHDMLLRRYGTVWRDAFEDLMLLERGRDMRDRGITAGSSKEVQQSGVEWVRRMAQSGVLRSMRCPYLFRPEEERDDDEDDMEDADDDDAEDMETELDVCESLDRWDQLKRQERANPEALPKSHQELQLWRMLDWYDHQKRLLDEEELAEPEARWDQLMRQQRQEMEALEKARQEQDRGLALDEYEDQKRLLREQSERRDRLMQLERLTRENQERGRAKQDEWMQPQERDEPKRYEKDAVALQPVDKADTSAQQGSGIIAMLSTTQTTTLPDGTVTTKTVLKKRFADGREESNETIHTSRGEDSRSGQPSPTDLPTRKRVDGEEDDKGSKTGSWFWSK